ncbi:hypothetical protein F5141DRAFT_1014544 [Pisolithus sp. B1]|nr:hypothetical protein F5141DRAFT_1014544 [Pisolithus sp. B1]
MTSKLDNEHILQVVSNFFEYVMFSHIWQGREPLFYDIITAKSIWNLPDTPLNEKLHHFCKEMHRLGHNWAWSDTCCIDKTTTPILNQSLTSMYKWYMGSAAMLVFLADIAHPSKPGDLMCSFWMTRAWTLQELLAPKVILFYDSEWKTYLGNASVNHKESPEIMRELADVIKIPCAMITTLSLGGLAIREKLFYIPTDVAYSLIGMFKSDIRPDYGEGAFALGHLLEEIMTCFGNVNLLAWSGKSSSFNSCLLASLSVYYQTPYNPLTLEEEEMETYITELWGKASQEVALKCL